MIDAFNASERQMGVVKGREENGREKSILHPLVHTIKTGLGQAKPLASGSVWISQVGGRHPRTWTITAVSVCVL